jgi:phosphatidate cytidylyltransferase
MGARIATAVIGIPVLAYAATSLSFVPIGVICLALSILIVLEIARVRFQLGWILFWLCGVAGFLSIALLHSNSIGGLFSCSPSPLMLFLAVIWVGDTMAMLIGSLFGRHQLAPGISPNKTWEGGITNLLCASAAGWLLAPIGAVHHEQGLGIGVLSGVFGQAGDLIESAWKRQNAIKDSGSLLPGHGGVLDRFDSALFAAPFVALFLSLSN